AIGDLGHPLWESDRVHFREALQYRGYLTTWDRAILDAIGPWFQVPADGDEVDRRLVALSESDEPRGLSEVIVSLCTLRTHRDDARALAACEEARTHAGDALPTALSASSNAMRSAGDVAGARAALERCAS